MASPAKVALQLRDVRLFEQLAARRALPLSHIHAHHFAGATRKTALNRLGLLARAGYLERTPLPMPRHRDGRPELVYTLTRAARSALALRSAAAAAALSEDRRG